MMDRVTTTQDMWAARLHGTADIRLHREPVPQPGDGLSLVRVTAVGLCGSDLHWWDEGGIGDARLDRPLVLGHESAGVIAAGPRRGLRVAIDPAIPCENCAQCRRGFRNLCPQVRFAGHGGTDGGLREYVAWPAHLLHPLPDGLTAAEGALLEPLGVALHAVDLGHVRLAGGAAVVGCGPIGLMIIQLLLLAGVSRVVAADPLPHRREAAAALGAEVLAGHGAGDAAAGTAFEVAGTDEAVATAITATEPGGRVVLVGIPDGDRTSFSASAARRKGLTFAMSRRMNETYPRAIALAGSGRVDLAGLVTRREPLERTPAAFAAAARREGLKVVVEPGSPA
jgi:L-iditol 2-dehydrogenase